VSVASRLLVWLDSTPISLASSSDLTSNVVMTCSSAVRSRLEGWREPALRAASLLAWDKDWYAGAVAGVVTLAFLLVWWWDPTLLTFLAVSGLFLTLTDYLGPKIMAQVDIL
jgi:asparagine N-glycosylation enzyme membrane subunit Stt3